MDVDRMIADNRRDAARMDAELDMIHIVAVLTAEGIDGTRRTPRP